jgi:hypothetical protein
MTGKCGYIFYSIAVCLAAVAMNSGILFAKDVKLEDILKGHIESIGSSEKVEGVKVRGIGGIALVDFIQGGTGKIQGQAIFLSEKDRLGIIMQFNATDYPGEHFAFDGKKVMINQILPGQKSPLGDFLYWHNALLKEGVLGGALSLNWPLLDVKKAEKKLKYKGEKNIDGVELLEVEYRFSDRKSNDLKTKLYFDPETFHHVRTEYRLTVQADMRGQADANVRMPGMTPARDQIPGRSEGPGGIRDVIPYSHYVLIEKFSDFKEADGLTLPHRYELEYSQEGRGSSFLANWTILASQIVHTGQIDELYFKADE